MPGAVLTYDPSEGVPRIPCAVCGRRSSGFHYGADTCGACKIFFRRNCKRVLEHRCKKGEKSDIKAECTKCRFDRCVSIGMSIEASKKGRYTFIRKHDYIVRSMELQKKQSESTDEIRRPENPTPQSQLSAENSAVNAAATEAGVQLPIAPTVARDSPKTCGALDDVTKNGSSSTSTTCSTVERQNSIAGSPLERVLLEDLHGSHKMSPQSSTQPTTHVSPLKEEVDAPITSPQSSGMENYSTTQHQWKRRNSDETAQLIQRESIKPTAMGADTPLWNEMPFPSDNKKHMDHESIRSMLMGTFPESKRETPLTVPEESSPFSRGANMIRDILCRQDSFSPRSSLSSSSREQSPVSSAIVPTFTSRHYPIHVNKNYPSPIYSCTTSKNISKPVETATPDSLGYHGAHDCAVAKQHTVSKDSAPDTPPIGDPFQVLYYPHKMEAPQVASHDIPVAPSTIRREMETLAQNITRMYLQSGTFPQGFFDLLPQREREFLEYKSLSHDMIGSQGELSLDDYALIYHDTGIDIDGRFQSVQARVVSYAARLTSYIMFMSRVPGFQDLPEIDRDALANAARPTFCALSEYRCYNPSLGLYTSPEGVTQDVAELKRQSPSPYVENVFRMASYLQSLHLSELERNILKCVALFSPDDCLTVEGAREAEKHRLFYVQMLEYLTRHKTYTDTTITMLLDTLDVVRKTITANCLSLRNYITQIRQIMDWQFPPGMVEFIETGSLSFGHQFCTGDHSQEICAPVNATN